MAKLSITAGATSQTVNVFIQDSSSTTGAGLTGLVYNSAGLTAYYALPKAAAAAVTLATLAAATSAWSSGGFKEIDSTNMPGWYRFDLPDASIASGRFSSVHLKGATNMAPCPLEIELTGWNNQDAVHGGMSALPNTACTTNASLVTSGTGTDQVSVTSGRVDTGKVSGTSQTARDIGASVLLSAGTGTGQVDMSSGVIKSNLVQMGGTAQSATDLKDFADTGYDPATHQVAGVVLTDTTTAITTKTGFALTSAYDPAKTAAQAGDAMALTALHSLNLQSGTAQAGAAGTITLAAGASATDDLYKGCEVTIYGGTGVGQSRIIAGYVGATKVATVDANWATTPDNTSTYRVLIIRAPKLDASLQTTAASVQGNVTGTVASVVGAVGSVTGAVGSVTGAVGSVTGAVGSVTGNVGGNVTGNLGGTLTSTERNAISDALLARSLGTEAYAADGAVPKVNEMLFMLWSILAEMACAGTTITTYKLNGSSTAMTFTVDDGVNPTTRTRAT